MSDSESQSEKFQFLGPDSFPYHQHRLGISTSSQIDEISPSPSIIEYHPQLTSLSHPPQGGDATPFKVPSFPSISSIIRQSRSSDENNGSSVQTAGEKSPRLSQFFQPTQESPPQAHSSPRLPLVPESIPAAAAVVVETSPMAPVARGWTPIAVREERERVQLEKEAVEEGAHRVVEEDSFATVPEHVRRRWAMEEKAHKMFDELRNVKIDVKRARDGNDSLINDYLFGTKSRVDPDGVRRVIRRRRRRGSRWTGTVENGLVLPLYGKRKGLHRRSFRILSLRIRQMGIQMGLWSRKLLWSPLRIPVPQQLMPVLSTVVNSGKSFLNRTISLLLPAQPRNPSRRPSLVHLVASWKHPPSITSCLTTLRIPFQRQVPSKKVQSPKSIAPHDHHSLKKWIRVQSSFPAVHAPRTYSSHPVSPTT